MDNKEVIEGNKLIAEFDMLSMVAGGFYPIAGKLRIAEQLEYHSSWDWLMPVVEKIGSIPHSFNVNINSFDGCSIYDDSYKRTAQGKIFNGTLNGSLITSVYDAVIQFIQWHNKEVNQINNQ